MKVISDKKFRLPLVVGLLISIVTVFASVQAETGKQPAKGATKKVASKPKPKPAVVKASSKPATLVKIDAYPKQISLTSNQDFQSIVVQATYSDGITRDITGKSKIQIENKAVAKIEKNVLRPIVDGKTKLLVSFSGKQSTLPVTVAKSKEARAISFKLDVMPVFMKAGCNQGSCHGSSRGKDGFMLSIFGYDPDGDYERITRQQLGRRINLAAPAESMLVEKATGAVPHTGGKQFSLDSEMCKPLVRWIEAGVPKDGTNVATCISTELWPQQAVLDGKGEIQQLTVLAHYSDGTTRDVTALAVFLTNNENSAAVTKEGLVTGKNRGEAFVTARYESYTVGSQFLVLPKGLKFAPKYDKPANYIDQLVNAKLMKIRMNPSPICSDDVFLRRVYLDLVGLLPTEKEASTFLADKAPNKRAKLIDTLINRKEFTELWVSKWAEWLMMRSNNQVSYKGVLLYYNWLAEQIGNNVPLDQMVQELLASSGGTFSVPATNFYEMEQNNLKVAENVAQVFMGMQIQCAQCHNHPFDRWTQQEYYNFAAFFSQVGRKRSEDYREKIIYNRASGGARHPVTKKNAPPVFLGGGAPKEDMRGKDRRKVLAKWLASPENPYFAENFANRIWDHFFGMGIVNPVDDVRVTNPASNPELLKALAKRMTETRYDFKSLVREICNSKTYQRSTRRNATNETDENNFAHQNVRRIKAESLLDIISQATETKDKFRGLPLGSRASQIADGRTTNYMLTTFGRSTRETVCTCEVRMEPTLSQALHLLNGKTTNGKIRDGKVTLMLVKQKKKPEEIIKFLYQRTLTRRPTKLEMESLLPLFAKGIDQNRAAEDVFWSLLNSREFLFNH